MTSFDDGPTRPFDGLVGSARRDRLVAWACGLLAVLQALPYVAVGWITDGGTAAGDGALDALSPSALLGVVAFGVVLAVALSRPGMQPLVDVGVEVDDTGGPLLPTRPTGPTRLTCPTWTTGSVVPRLRWAAFAALAEAATVAGAALLVSAESSGAFSVGDALDDGSALGAYVATVVQVLLMDVRAPTAFVVALVVLARARRPVSRGGDRRARPDGGARPAARTTRPSPDRPPS